jgi:amino-acid N-acetyltransferase
LADLRSLGALIAYYSRRDVLLPRTPEDLRQRIHDFHVIESNNEVIACGMLQLYTPAVAELRSLAVSEEWHGSGLGRRIVEGLLAEARASGLETVFAFTTSPGFFSRMGFSPIDRDLVPWKAWNDCVACPKRECCDEVAMAYSLKPAQTRPGHHAQTHPKPDFPILSGR